MIPVPSSARMWITADHTDMRRGLNGLSLLVQQCLGRDPFSGDLYVFRGRRGDLIKCLWHDRLDCHSTPSAWNGAGSFGPRRRARAFPS